MLQAWRIIDKNGDGVLNINDIQGTYDASKHPDVVQGKRTEAEILGEFLETFEQHHNSHSGARNDQVVTPEEWTEYYTNVSSSIDRDDYFELMMNRAWKMGPENKTYATGWSNVQGGAPKAKVSDTYGEWSHKNATGDGARKSDWLGYRPQTTAKPHYNENVLQTSGSAYGATRAAPPSAHSQRSRPPFGVTPEPAPQYSAPPTQHTAPTPDQTQHYLKVFRDTIAKRGARGIYGLARNFRIIDDDRSMTLDRTEFSKAMNDFRIPLGPEERQAVFEIFDVNHDGCIDYDEFLRGTVGEMNTFRRNFV